MRAAVAAIAIALLACVARAEEDRAFVELSTDRSVYYVGESVPVRVRVGMESRFLRDHLIQPFQRALELPVRARVGWWNGTERAPVVAAARGPEGRATFAVNDDVVAAAEAEPEMRNGRRFRVVELSRVLVPEVAGALELDAVRVSFSYSMEFEEDFARGRVPLDPLDTFVESDPLVVTVRDVPDAGRPATYRGAIGSFVVTGGPTSRDIPIGESVTYRLRIEGVGNIERFDTPEFPDVPDFHVYGTRRSRTAEAVEFLYDLTRVDATSSVFPAFEFTYFDPAETAFRTLSTEAVELVELAGGGSSAGRAEASGGTEPESSPRWPLAVVVVGAVLGLIVLARRRRPLESSSVDAAAALARTALESPGTEPADVLTSFLAVTLECEPAAVVGPGLAGRLTRAGVDDALAGRASRHLERLVAARFGGSAITRPEIEATRALIDQVETAVGLGSAATS